MSGVDFEQALRTALVGNAGVSALVGSKVYALTIPQGVALPCITYQRVSGAPQNTLEGHSGAEAVLIQLDCWAVTFSAAKGLAKAVRSAMAAAPFKNTLDEDRDDHDPDTTYYRVSADFRCWHQE